MAPDSSPRERVGLAPIRPLSALSVPVAVAPFGYLLGGLFTVHVVASEARAVWLTTVALTVAALCVVSLRS